MLIKDEMIRTPKLEWRLRSARKEDAAELSKLRLRIDAETNHLDREAGEDCLSDLEFENVIKNDLAHSKDMFFVSEINGQIVGFARCISRKLNRFSHQSDFGICILKQFCGYGIGKALLKKIIELAEEIGIEKILLSVIETNSNAINLYQSFGFKQEGILLKDRKIDGKYYNTIIMGRIKEN